MYRGLDIARAAQRIIGHMRSVNGGRLPRRDRLRGWLVLAGRYGLTCLPCERSQALSAQLVRTEWGEWLALYNARRREDRQVRSLAHEIAEYIAIGDYPTLFDGMPGVYGYDGAGNPRDVRHRIALEVERQVWGPRR